ncbi:spermatogenesis-associated protein 7 isoform X3 [Biomphalaria pfeifferi]|uniref:Spermatogenesis-associated protein 7 isoform X3 n=1 Tax=Biomphalaria pfeifferi TaxID=112525 RepID=A0AAD8F0Q8_BIOPF|nr:spermatogenesis-associated protein 7 isoform X3 [Biomphalaria pfeifferi]
MAESLRGNLGLKSSPLAPTACKLSTQYLVLDHMTNHYNKIAKARSVIDTKPPKSLTTSQKMRDRRNRESRMNTPTLLKSFSRSHSDLQNYHDLFNDEPEDEDSRLVHSIMKATLTGQPGNSNKATYGSTSLNESHNLDSSMLLKQGGDTHMGSRSFRPVSARSTQSLRSARSGHSVTSLTSRVSIHDPAKVTYQGDLLDKRPHLFTEPDRAFTPRTLKVNHESKLKNSKWYNPPRRSSSQSRASMENTGSKPSSVRNKKSELLPRPNASNQDLQDAPETAHLSESMLMDITLRSRDGHQQHEGNGMVPPLAISMDQDHMNWLQEQASKAEVRARSQGKLRSSIHSDEDSQVQALKSKNTDLRDAIKLEKTNKDEEQKYLNFAKEVTDDVRSRGICADSVLHLVFENHIERRKHELDEGKMRKVIKDLKRNLGIPEYVPSPVSSYSSKRKESHSSNLGTENAQSSSTKDDPVTSSAYIDTMSMAAQNLNGHSDMISTLNSTSSISFGKTKEILSTINSEAALEDVSENGLDGDDLLKQYQLNITAKDAKGELIGNDDASFTETYSSQQLSRIPRPATGERRVTDDDDRMSQSSSVPAMSSVSTNSRAKRRELKKVNAMDSSSSVASQSYSHNGNDHLELDKGSLDNHDHTLNKDSIDDNTSVKSSLSSSRPVAKPRGSRSGAAINQSQQSSQDALQDEVINENDHTPQNSPSPQPRSQSHHSEVSQEKTDDDYEEDYEEDEGNDADEDDEQGSTTHRTSDDDF